MSISLKLFVAGRTGIGAVAERNLHNLVGPLGSGVEVEIIDVLEHPALAARDHILATPAVVRIAPPPRRKVIGDLSEQDLVLAQLDLMRVPDERTHTAQTEVVHERGA